MDELAAESFEPDSPAPLEHNVFAASPINRLNGDQIEMDFEKDRHQARSNQPVNV